MVSRVGSIYLPSTLHYYDCIYEVYLISGWAEDIKSDLEKQKIYMWCEILELEAHYIQRIK